MAITEFFAVLKKMRELRNMILGTFVFSKQGSLRQLAGWRGQKGENEKRRERERDCSVK